MFIIICIYVSKAIFIYIYICVHIYKQVHKHKIDWALGTAQEVKAISLLLGSLIPKIIEYRYVYMYTYMYL
jgi:hypothetical protein